MLNLQPLYQRSQAAFLLALSMPSAAFGFALSVQISALSWLLSTQYGLEIHEIGLVWAAGPLAGIIGQVSIGLISDRSWFWGGRRRPFVFIGAFIGALMLLALPNIGLIAEKISFISLIGVAIIVALTLDISINVGFNPSRAIIADVTDEGPDRARAFSWAQSVSGTMGVAAYAIGALWGNFTLIYLSIFVVLLCCIVPMFFVQEDQHSGEQGEQRHHASLAEILLAIKPLWAFGVYAAIVMPLRVMHIELDHHWLELACIAATIVLILSDTWAKPSSDRVALVHFRRASSANAMAWIAAQTMFVYFIAFVQERFNGLDDTETGQVISISFLVLNAVAAILPALVLAPVAKKLGASTALGVSLAIMTLGYLSLWFAGYSVFSVYGLMILVGVGWAATVSLSFAVMSEGISDTNMGLYMGLFNLSIVLPQLFVSLAIGPWIQGLESASAMFLVCAGATTCSALLWLRAKKA